MGFTDEKRNQIKWYILEKIENHQNDIAKRTSQAFGISLNTVYRYIRELEKENIIDKNGRMLKLKEKEEHFFLSRQKGQMEEEDQVYNKYIKKYIDGLPDNVKQIWQYSFMEMMNNAIDHSQAESVIISVIQNYISTYIMISDNGIGIFKKIKDYYGYDSLDDAVNELFKGKLTTDKNNHSGEGIFFTSRVLDSFAALSDGKIFTHDNFSELTESMENIESLKRLDPHGGTMIFMGLSNFSKKILKEVFDMFSDEDGSFIRTRIPIKNIYDTYPVSRSQAKRLCHRFENFREIELDFSGIEEIGQGFAHELFVVFQNNHPDIKLIPMNTTEDVKKMINHVLQGRN